MFAGDKFPSSAACVAAKYAALSTSEWERSIVKAAQIFALPLSNILALADCSGNSVCDFLLVSIEKLLGISPFRFMVVWANSIFIEVWIGR